MRIHIRYALPRTYSRLLFTSPNLLFLQLKSHGALTLTLPITIALVSGSWRREGCNCERDQTSIPKACVKVSYIYCKSNIATYRPRILTFKKKKYLRRRKNIFRLPFFRHLSRHPWNVGPLTIAYLVLAILYLFFLFFLLPTSFYCFTNIAPYIYMLLFSFF